MNEIKINAKVNAEWDKPKDILMYTPGIEMKFGAIRPSGALFEGILNYVGAEKEHMQLKDVIRKKTGANVYDLRDLMISGIFDENNWHMQNLTKFNKLRDFAEKSITHNYENIDDLNIRKSELEKLAALDMMSPNELIDVIMLGLNFNISNSSTMYKSTKNQIIINPVYNMTFSRDQMITTPNGIIIGKMKCEEREREIEIAKFALENINANILTQIRGQGTLEGGDYVSGGEIGFLGNGCRTNRDSIEQLLKDQNKFFANQILGIIVDPMSDQDHMHLDTYFNVLDKKKVIIDETRFYATGDNAPTIELYLNGNKIGNKIKFREFLEKEDYKIAVVSSEIQKNYGVNFLTVDKSKIIGVDFREKKRYFDNIIKVESEIVEKKGLEKALVTHNGMDYEKLTKEYFQALNNIGVKTEDITLVNIDNLNRAYGSIHCLTQVLRRD